MPFKNLEKLNNDHMGANASIYIRIKGSTDKMPVEISNLGDGDDFFFLLDEGLSHNLKFELKDHVFERIKQYNFVEDMISPMLDDDPVEPDYRHPSEIIEIVNLIENNVLLKLKSEQIKMDAESSMYVANLFKIIGGILSVANYAKSTNDEIAIVHAWF